ncbi:MAG: DUF3623 family protein [Gammaproteobacteria bacterium]|nr:DUF3623 family protein [Gammaproteobacteria bacterium]
MDPVTLRRFVGAQEAVRVQSPWTVEEWMCRSDVVSNEHLLMVLPLPAESLWRWSLANRRAAP